MKHGKPDNPRNPVARALIEGRRGGGVHERSRKARRQRTRQDDQRRLQRGEPDAVD